MSNHLIAPLLKVFFKLSELDICFGVMFTGNAVVFTGAEKILHTLESFLLERDQYVQKLNSFL